jgi:hypothetical protein
MESVHGGENSGVKRLYLYGGVCSKQEEFDAGDVDAGECPVVFDRITG